MEDLNKNEPLTQIEKLKKGLFFKVKKKIVKKEPELKPKKYDVSGSWVNKEEMIKKAPTKKKKTKITFFGKLLIFSILFFLMSTVIAFYVFFKGVNVISTENVDISISGPSSAGGGEELSFQITVQNNNSVNLELTDLIIEYPSGTLSADDRGTNLNSVRESLDTIRAGSSTTNIFKSVLFGNEGDTKEILVTIEYRAEDSNAIFFKERKYEVLIDSSPIVFVVDNPDKVMSGQEFEMEIEIISNSNKVVKDFIFEADYPFGFEFKSSNIKATDKDNIWNFGDIEPNSKKSLKIIGVLEGPDKEERVFRFFGGSEDQEESNMIKAKLASYTNSVVIKKSLIGAELVLNGSYAPEFSIASGSRVRADILYSNNLSTKVTDVEVEVSINGLALDKFSISTDKGFYRSSDNIIYWNKKTFSDLALLNPEQNGNLSFSFDAQDLSYISNAAIKNPDINLELVIRANQLSSLDGNEVEKIETKISKKIKVNTDLMLNARALYSVGAFENSGPIPPRVNKETSYTVVLTATNSSNAISKARMMATLPSYVKWSGNISPSNEDISFKQVGGEISWDIGDIDAGAGISTSAKELSFQVILKPSLSQLFEEPILLDNIQIEGVDDFTGSEIIYKLKAIDTRLGTDPIYKSGDGEVIE